MLHFMHHSNTLFASPLGSAICMSYLNLVSGAYDSLRLSSLLSVFLSRCAHSVGLRDWESYHSLICVAFFKAAQHSSTTPTNMGIPLYAPNAQSMSWQHKQWQSLQGGYQGPD